LRIKLDENLGPSAAAVFRDAGHDVLLAVEQGLGGNEDRVLIEVCRAEDRALVTLDLDFANILNFPPNRYRGIAVLRLPKPISQADLLQTCRTLVRALEQRTLTGKLWIVKGHQIREWWSDAEEP
jgi:predicted nuclease of predicted toxin-antitoxin system